MLWEIEAKDANERKAALTEMSLPNLTKALLLHGKEVDLCFSDFSPELLLSGIAF